MQVITPPLQDKYYNESKIQHINSIGAVIDDCLLLHAYSKPPIDIHTIRKAEIFKTISVVYNLLFAIGAFGLGMALFLYHFTLLEILFVSVLMAFLLGCAYFFKNSRYTLFIRTTNLDYMEFEVNTRNKEDAKKIVKIVNQKIRQIRRNEKQQQN